MGTNRLGDLPRTKPWRRIVAAFVAGAGAAQVAGEALDLLAGGLGRLADDPVVVEAVRLLMLLPAAAKGPDFAGALRGVGVDAPDGPDFCDVLAAVSGRLDAVTPAGRGRSDAGEVAQAALSEALAETVGRSLGGLFDATPGDARRAFARQSSDAHFGTLAGCFFGKFTEKWLQSFLSRELPLHVGPGQRLPSLGDYGQFSGDLRVHCRETAKVVEGFAAEWRSREAFRQQGEIDRGRVKEFVYGAFAKLTRAMTPGAR